MLDDELDKDKAKDEAVADSVMGELEALLDPHSKLHKELETDTADHRKKKKKKDRHRSRSRDRKRHRSRSRDRRRSRSRSRDRGRSRSRSRDRRRSRSRSRDRKRRHRRSQSRSPSRERDRKSDKRIDKKPRKYEELPLEPSVGQVFIISYVIITKIILILNVRIQVVEIFRIHFFYCLINFLPFCRFMMEKSQA